MRRPPGMRPHTPTKKATDSRYLQEDVAALIALALPGGGVHETNMEAARDIIVIVRERVLEELGTYARQNVR